MHKQAIFNTCSRVFALTEICQKANINRHTFYDHYIDKDELLREIENELLHEIEMSAIDIFKISYNKDNTDEYISYVKKILDYFYDNKYRLLPFLSDYALSYFRIKLNNLIKEKSFAHMYSNSINFGPMHEYAMIVISNAFSATLEYWTKNQTATKKNG